MMLLRSNYIKSLLKRQIQTTLEKFKESHRFLLDMHHYAVKEHSVEHKDIYYSADYALLQLKLVWKEERQPYFINAGLQIASRERIAAFSVFVSPHVAV